MNPARNSRHHSTGSGFRVNPVWALSVFALAHSRAFAQEGAGDIRDIKDLVEIPAPPNYSLWIGLAAAALLLAYAIWRWLSRKRKVIGIDPDVRALRVLDQCEALLAEESPEPLVIAVTGAVRSYLEERFGIAAPRRTTEEFLREVNAGSDRGILPFREDLGRFLHLCDSVKFGRGGMDAGRRRDLVEGARGFIEATRKPKADP
jgi:hypothetical protein